MMGMSASSILSLASFATLLLHGLAVSSLSFHEARTSTTGFVLSRSVVSNAFVSRSDAINRSPQTLFASRRSESRKTLATKLRCALQDDWEQFVLDVQSSICSEAENADGQAKFIVDRWDRGEGKGYGITRVLEGGSVWEKAACSVSVVKGELTKDRAAAMSSRGRDATAGQPYSAAACSMVFHSASPMVPTFRADVRYFQIEGGTGWFGGGADLTPYYLIEEDATDFHQFYKDICDRHDPKAYETYKEWCDRYFYIPARHEHRGVGGIFFDDLEKLPNGEDPLQFVKEVADGFMPSYLPIVEKRRGLSFTEEQRQGERWSATCLVVTPRIDRQWQLLRRGRYLEFNLLYDRGVRFGLDGQGRTESVMVSAPPLIAWKYNVQPEKGSEEEKLVSVLQQPREWVA